jgi:2-oxoglutarate/2-oxoacid ferredoxin oxidoreductase subunit alpha
MGIVDVAAHEPELTERREKIVNDFNIEVATVNGSGSQTANLVLLRAIFQMGIPASGKNLFPSNIAGLPTWYTVRVSKNGYVARKQSVDIVVAMNPESAKRDVLKLDPGAVAIYDEVLDLKSLRDDLIYYAIPFDKLVAKVCPEARLRKLVRNMIYDGVLARLLGIDMSEIESSLRKQFRKKPKAADLNFKAVQAGYEFTAQHLTKMDPYQLERMNLTRGKIIIDGNSAAALGCMFAGVTVVTWYPITPSSSLCESLIEYLKRYRIDKKTGKATFAVVQAEDELAALGMAIGAGWTGARAMTSTSGPGISLMAEFAGFAYYAEIPVVIFDIQRVGPSTGLPTRTSQSDILFASFLSHGDTKHVLLLPSSVEECFQFAVDAFDLADELQTPVFVMSDLDLGMNNWMSDPFAYPDQPFRRGKVLSSEDLDRVNEFARYADPDGDGIGYRTLPGNPHPKAAYFTRGSGHNERAEYTERPDDYARNMDRLSQKYETARQRVPSAIVEQNPNAKIGLIAFGSSHWAVVECRDRLLAHYQLETSYLRLRAVPFGPELQAFIRDHDRVYIIEQNRDGQMHSLIRLDVQADLLTKLRSVRQYDGLPISAGSIVEGILSQEGFI